MLASYLRDEFPDPPAARCRTVALAIISLVNSRFELMEIGVSKKYTQTLRASAKLLIDSLEVA